MTFPMPTFVPVPSAGGGYSFTMTAEDYASTFVGYYPGVPFGSIDADPFTGEGGSVLYIYDVSGSLGFSIAGDFTAQFSGKQLYIEGVVYDPGGNCGFARYDSDPPNEDWRMIYTDDGTESGGNPTAYGFADATEYLIEIK